MHHIERPPLGTLRQAAASGVKGSTVLSQPPTRSRLAKRLFDGEIVSLRPRGGRNEQIDALRGLAAGLVLALHAMLLPVGSPVSGFNDLTSFTDFVGVNLDGGVDLFFVVSGFLITLPFVRGLLDPGAEPPRIGSYVIKRAFRLLPVYWVALTIYLTFPSAPLTTRAVAWFALPWQGVDPSHARDGIPIAWSLTCELIFYVLVPVIAFAILRCGQPTARAFRVWSLVASLLSVGVTVLVAATHSDGGLVYDWVYFSPLQLYLFVPGVLVAVAAVAPGDGPVDRWWRASTGTVVGFASASVLCLLATFALFKAGSVLSPLHRLPRAVLSALLLQVAVNGRLPRLAVRAFVPLGVISYSLYLWHFVVVRFLDTYDVFNGSAGRYGAVLDVTVVATCAIPLSFASYLVVERPMTRLGRGLARLPPRTLGGKASADVSARPS